MERVEVFGFGHCCVDYLCVLDPYPDKGKKGEVARSLVSGGGPVPTALLTLARFGHSTRFCGRVGDDDDGRLVASGLGGGGVDLSTLTVDPGAVTARAHIWIDSRDGSRTIALDRTGIRYPDAGDLDPEWVRRSRVFLCDAREPTGALKGFRAARKAGVITVLDAGSLRPGMHEILPLVDYAVVSRDLADSYAPGAEPSTLARLLLEAGAGTAVVTDGSNGAWFKSAAGEGLVPGFAVDSRDTTGAGDVFHGGFIHCLLEGLPLKVCIRTANAAAALSTRRLSGAGGIPSWGEVEALVKVHF